MEAIAIVDFGGQYAHLIGNRVRRLNIYSEVVLPNIRPSRSEATSLMRPKGATFLANLSKYKGIILSGGPQSVYETGAPTIDKGVFSLGIPVLGLCYGHQLVAHLLGGKVAPGKTKEYGLAKLTVLKKIGIFEGVHDHIQVWMSHGDTVEKLPPNFLQLGKTPDCEFAAIGDPARKIFSSQFHMEVTHTHEGMKMLDNFLALCRVKREWSMDRFLEQKFATLKRSIGDRNVFLLVSGGVDSTVAYALLSKVLGSDRVYGLFVDTGFLRKNEGKKIAASLKKIGVKNLHVVSAKKKFFDALRGTANPEEKRKIIGDVFLQVQAEAAHKLHLNPDRWMLGQGTIYPDTIESAGTKHADKIKTHHNRVPEILELIKKGRVSEPLAELYKDEVRELGKKLGLPDEIIWKHPFPGPGLAVRILCAEKEQYPADTGVIEEAMEEQLIPYGLHAKILPIQSVGVQGDARTYRNPVVIFGKHHAFDELENLSTALTNRFFAINRVCLLLAPEQIHSVGILPGMLTEKRIKLAQELDDIVMNFIRKNKIEREMWQFPTVLLPISVNGVKRNAVVLRPVCSEEAMTANFYKMDWILLQKLTVKLLTKVSAVFYDITNKPPGTIEWE